MQQKALSVNCAEIGLTTKTMGLQDLGSIITQNRLMWKMWLLLPVGGWELLSEILPTVLCLSWKCSWQCCQLQSNSGNTWQDVKYSTVWTIILWPICTQLNKWMWVARLAAFDYTIHDKPRKSPVSADVPMHLNIIMIIITSIQSFHRRCLRNQRSPLMTPTRFINISAENNWKHCH